MNMKCDIKNNFNGEINGVILYDEQSYDYLRDFIEELEDMFNLEINNKEATEFLRNELYEETESLYNVVTDDYYEAHCKAMDNLSDNISIIKGLLNYRNKKVII